MNPSDSTPPSPPRRSWAARLSPPIVLMGVPFDQVSMAQAVDIIEQMIQSRQPHLLATANINFLAQARRDPVQHRILVAADLVVCDGTPLVWISRWLGDPLPERVAGSDLVPLLLDLAERKGYSAYFLGGRDEVVAEAEKRIRARWPRLRVAGMYSPPFAPLEKMDHADIRRRIREARADLLFVCFGCPKQEKWLEINYREAGVPVNIGVGGTIDFLAGAMKRAPMWMRRCGLEWLYRAAQEPGRLAGRYWRDMLLVVPALARQVISLRLQGRRRTPTAPAPEPVPSVVLVLPARLDAVAARESEPWAAAEASTAAWIVADASHTTFMDSTGTGRLLRLARQARERGGKLVLAGPTPELLRTLDLMQLRSFFAEAPDLAAARAQLPGVS